MKKTTALALAAAFSLSVAGTALADENPFIDVPANHWAYDYVLQLQKTGIIGGYADGTFRGDRNLTRYEIAAIVARIPTGAAGSAEKENPLIKRLQTEFAAELKALGVRIDDLEKTSFSTIRFSGDARVRYQMNYTLPVSKDSNGTSRFQERVRIYTDAKVNDNVTFKGRLKSENAVSKSTITSTVDTSQNNAVFFDRAYFNWKSSGEGKIGLAFGRLEDNYGGLTTIGQGLIWGGERIDGAAAYYAGDKLTFKLGVADFSLPGDVSGDVFDNQPATTRWVTIGHLGYDFTKSFGLTVGYSDLHNSDKFKQLAFGGKIKSGDLTLIGEYVENKDAKNLGNYYEKKGAWARAQYGQAKFGEVGSYHVYGEYLRLGGDSILGYGLNQFDQGYSSGRILSRSNRSGAGVKGVGLGIGYIVGKNQSLLVAYHNLKSFDGRTDYRDQWTLATNLAF